MQVKDLMHNDYHKISSNETVSKALGMLHNSADVIFVHDDAFKGVVTRKAILVTGFKPAETKVTAVMKPAPAVHPAMDHNKVAYLAAQSEVMHLPVIENGKLVGAVDSTSLLTDVPEETLENYMTADPLTLRPHDSIAKAQSLMRKHDISHIPIVEDEQLVGLISMYDIIMSYRPKKRADWGTYMERRNKIYGGPVRDLMIREPVTLPKDDSVSKAAQLMAQRDISSVLVTQMGSLVGIVTTRDILASLATQQEGLVPPMINVVAKYEDVDMQEVGDTITSYTEKQKHLLKRSMFNVYVGRHREENYDKPLIFVRLNVQTPVGRFAAYGEGFGQANAMKKVLSKLDKQIERKLDLQNKTREKHFAEPVDSTI